MTMVEFAPELTDSEPYEEFELVTISRSAWSLKAFTG
jgi:hypothetical protein